MGRKYVTRFLAYLLGVAFFRSQLYSYEVTLKMLWTKHDYRIFLGPDP